jgi:hypothetical protein
MGFIAHSGAMSRAPEGASNIASITDEGARKFRRRCSIRRDPGWSLIAIHLSLIRMYSTDKVDSQGPCAPLPVFSPVKVDRRLDRTPSTEHRDNRPPPAPRNASALPDRPSLVQGPRTEHVATHGLDHIKRGSLQRPQVGVPRNRHGGGLARRPP